MQVCSEPKLMHCSTGQGKMHSPLFSVALQNRLTPGTVSMQLHLWVKALHTGVQCCNTNVLHILAKFCDKNRIKCSGETSLALLVPSSI